MNKYSFEVLKKAVRNIGLDEGIKNFPNLYYKEEEEEYTNVCTRISSNGEIEFCCYDEEYEKWENRGIGMFDEDVNWRHIANICESVENMALDVVRCLSIARHRVITLKQDGIPLGYFKEGQFYKLS